MNNDTFNWDKFLDSEHLKSNLIAASLFITAYEMFRSSIIDPIHSFYTFGNQKPEDKYKEEVLSRSKHTMEASVLWLKEMQAIDDDDVNIVKSIRTHRNKLAHELPKFIMYDNVNVDVNLFELMYQLLSKIDTWWILNFEIPTVYPEISLETDTQVQSGPMICLQMIIKLATSPNKTTLV